MSGLKSAGIFSTDDPIADQDQIDREQYVDPLEEEEEYYREIDPRDDPVDIDPYEGQEEISCIFCCPTPDDPEHPWWASETFFACDRDLVLERLQKEHDEWCSCGYIVT